MTPSKLVNILFRNVSLYTESIIRVHMLNFNIITTETQRFFETLQIDKIPHQEKVNCFSVLVMIKSMT